jgi:hypothetical protein
MIAMGQPEESFCLLEVLYRLSTNQPLSSTPSPAVDPSVAAAALPVQDRKKKEKGAADVGFASSNQTQRQSHSQPETSQKREEPDLTRRKQQTKRQIKFGSNQTQLIPTREEETDQSDTIGELVRRRRIISHSLSQAIDPSLNRHLMRMRVSL